MVIILERLFGKLKSFFVTRFRQSLNEAAALPAIMVGAILISATAVLLAGFALTMTKNAELNIVKTNSDFYLNSCEAELEKITFSTFPSEFDTVAGTGVDNPKDAKPRIVEALKNGACDKSEVKIRLVGEPALTLPTGETDINKATSVKISVAVDVNKGALVINDYDKVDLFLDYAERQDKVLSPDSYIDSFDEKGHAVWVTPDT